MEFQPLNFQGISKHFFFLILNKDSAYGYWLQLPPFQVK